MAEITKTYVEDFPAARFVGKRYSKADGDNGGYGHIWGQWLQESWFGPLEALGDTGAG